MRGNTWFLIIAAGLIGYALLQGGEQRFASAPRRLNYDVVAVSQGLTPQAQALNLSKELDVSLLPDIGKEAIRDAAKQGLQKQAFLEAVLREVSDRVRQISTIDLNKDGEADPILVRPEPSPKEGYVLLSLRVPAPDAYPLPNAKDTAAWKKVDTFEVATMAVSLNQQQLTVQATPNPQLYPGAADQHYYAYDRTPSFLQTYFAIRMLDWMFYPPMYGFWGPGWGYGFYRPMGVPTIINNRSTVINRYGYSRAPSSASSVVRGRTGVVPRSAYSRAYSRRPPRALRELQGSRRFARRRAGSAVRSGGFGRGRTVRRAVPSRRYSGFRSRSRGFGGITRGYSRGFSRGFGRGFRGFSRGFGGFGRGFRFRR